MGHKLHPKSLRLGFIQPWESMWFSEKNMAANIYEDFKVREFVAKKYQYSGVSRVIIERHPDIVKVDIHTARPALVIGRKGQDKENLKNEVQKIVNKNVIINVIEVLKPDLDAAVVAEGIVMQLEKKINHRRASKRAMERTMSAGAKGIKVMIGGRIGGAEIARNEWFKQGRVPLSTFRADIDFTRTYALTKYGKIGIKVWIYKGDIIKKRNEVKKNDPILKGEEEKNAASQES